tara:strand:- start:349 stop:1314 length:966 start_codon:yes stop_codon:yes gene_type:complete
MVFLEDSLTVDNFHFGRQILIECSAEVLSAIYAGNNNAFILSEFGVVLEADNTLAQREGIRLNAQSYLSQFSESFQREILAYSAQRDENVDVTVEVGPLALDSSDLQPVHDGIVPEDLEPYDPNYFEARTLQKNFVPQVLSARREDLSSPVSLRDKVVGFFQKKKKNVAVAALGIMASVGLGAYVHKSPQVDLKQDVSYEPPAVSLHSAVVEEEAAYTTVREGSFVQKVSLRLHGGGNISPTLQELLERNPGVPTITNDPTCPMGYLEVNNVENGSRLVYDCVLEGDLVSFENPGGVKKPKQDYFLGNLRKLAPRRFGRFF